MLVQDTLSGKRAVVCFVRLRQRMLLAAFPWMLGVGMKPDDPCVPGIRDRLDRGPHPDLRILVQTEIMRSPAGEARAEHLPGRKVDHHLSFYRVPLLFARVVPPLLFFGR